jgi:hypothetical protein
MMSRHSVRHSRGRTNWCGLGGTWVSANSGERTQLNGMFDIETTIAAHDLAIVGRLALPSGLLASIKAARSLQNESKSPI